MSAMVTGVDENRRPLSICMLSNLFHPVVSGSSTQSRILSGQLVEAGHKPFVITARVDRSTPEKDDFGGVPVYRLPCIRVPKMPISLNFPWLSWTFLPGNLERIRRIFLRHRPDVIHLHNHMFDLAFSGVWLRRQFRVPLVVTIHTMIRHSSAVYNMLLYPADRIFLRYTVARHADLMICPDVNIRDYVYEAFPTTDTALVPYGITPPPPADPEAVAEVVKRHDLEGRRVILSLGHVHEIRNRRDEVAAMKEILGVFPDAVLLIVGKEATETPRKLARELEIEDSIIFAGPRPHEEVPAYIGAAEIEAHLFTQDARERTSLGIATEEVMAAGLPAIVSANPNTLGPGVLKPGENFFNVPRNSPKHLAETIIDLLKDPDRRRRVGEAGRQTILDQCSWDSVCRQNLAVYRDMIDRLGTHQGDRNE